MKKKLLAVIAVSAMITAESTAQSYVNTFTGTAFAKTVQTYWNTSSVSPVTLSDYNGGFMLQTFAEANGAATSRSWFVDTKYVPVATAQAGANEMVLGRNNVDCFYSLVPTLGGNAVYTFNFPRNFPGDGVSNINPVDIVYDGVQYFYALFSLTYTSGTYSQFCYGVMKINGINGGVTTMFYNYTGQSEHFYPDDIEFVDNSHIYVTGTYDGTNGVRYYFIGKGTNNAVINGTAFNYFNFTLNGQTPANLYVKGNGTSLYLAGDMKNALPPSAPLVLFQLTDNNNNTYTVNNSNYYTYNLKSGGISSFDYRSGYMLVGGINGNVNAGLNFLFNAGTWTITSVHSYTTTGLNYLPKSIYSPASSRVFSAIKDNVNNVLCNLRTGVNDCSAPCSAVVSPVTSTLHSPTTNLSRAAKYFNLTPAAYVTTYSPKIYSPSAQCQAIVPQAQDHQVREASPVAGITLSPNPADASLSIQSGTEATISRIMIYDFSGKLVADETQNNNSSVSLNTTAYEAGIYFVMIQLSDGQMLKEKVVISH